jgi:transcriptional regulator with XRE-family HTH domain
VGPWWRTSRNPVSGRCCDDCVLTRLTQEELAQRARVSARTVSDLERGISVTARPSTARLLADALDLEQPQRRVFEAAARVVNTRLERLTPRSPRFRMIRAVWSRPIAHPFRRISACIFRTP